MRKILADVTAHENTDERPRSEVGEGRYSTHNDEKSDDQNVDGEESCWKLDSKGDGVGNTETH